MSWSFEYLTKKDKDLESKIKDSYLQKLGVAHQSLIDYPVDLWRFAEDIGVDVKYGRLSKGVYGMIRPQGPKNRRKYEIRVRAADPPRRRRFTLAHELAHYLLDIDPKQQKRVPTEDITEDVFLRDENLAGSGAEWNANALAAHILMPIPKIEEALLNRKGLTIPKLADMFDVSELAMKVRLGIPIDPI